MNQFNHILGVEEPGWLERLGLRLYHRFAARNKQKTHLNGSSGPALSDDRMAAEVRWILARSLTIAFSIGAISAAGSVYAEYLFPETACANSYFDPACLQKYGVVALTTLVLATCELLVLGFVSVWTVFQLARITGSDRLTTTAGPDGLAAIGHDQVMNNFSDPVAARVPNLLARAALEIPDPVREVLGIDPMRNVPKRVMLLMGVLYRLKITASNVIAKFILRRIFGKSALRVGAAYIAVPITGAWNAIVTYRVAREARLRLFGSILARHIVETELDSASLEQLSPRARLGCLQAVGNAIVFARSNHPNLMILLARLYHALRSESQASSIPDAKMQIPNEPGLADWQEFLATLAETNEQERKFLRNLLSIAAAFDGRISRLERKYLGDAFGEQSEMYFHRIRRLQRALLKGRLNAAKSACRLKD